MKLAHIFMLICAAFLSASPALAHGDEVHGETPSAQVPAQPDKMAGMEGMHSSQIAPGEPVPGEGNAGSKSGEHESDNAGFFAFLTKLHPATVHFPVALFLMAALAWKCAPRWGTTRDYTGCRCRMSRRKHDSSKVAGHVFQSTPSPRG